MAPGAVFGWSWRACWRSPLLRASASGGAAIDCIGVARKLGRPEGSAEPGHEQIEKALMRVL